MAIIALSGGIEEFVSFITNLRYDG